MGSNQWRINGSPYAGQFSGCLAAVRAGLGVAVMPRAMVPPGLDVLAGWPDLAPAELAILGRDRPAPAAALAAFITARVHRQI